MRSRDRQTDRTTDRDRVRERERERRVGGGEKDTERMREGQTDRQAD